MADTDRCELIEAWAREALADELPEDAVVRAESADGDNTYTLVVEVPQGEGAQQLANSLQSRVAELAGDDPTLGDRFVEAKATPSGVDLLQSGDAGARSKWELELTIPEDADESDEEDADESDEEDDTESDDPDDDDSDDDGDDESGEEDSDGDRSDDDGDDDQSDDDERSDDDSDGGEEDEGSEDPSERSGS